MKEEVREAMCHFPWITRGDDYHIAQYDHVCKLPAMHDGDHVCGCGVTIAKVGVTLGELLAELGERAINNPAAKAWPIAMKGGGPLNDERLHLRAMTLDNDSKMVYLDFVG